MIPAMFRRAAGDANAGVPTTAEKAVRFGATTQVTIPNDLTVKEKEQCWYQKSELRYIKYATVQDLTNLFHNNLTVQYQEEKCFRGLEIYVQDGSSRRRTACQKELVQGLLRLQYVQTRQQGNVDQDQLRSYVLKTSTAAGVVAQNLAAQDALHADYIYKYDTTPPPPLGEKPAAAAKRANHHHHHHHHPVLIGRTGQPRPKLFTLARGRLISKPSLPNRQRSFTARTV